MEEKNVIKIFFFEVQGYKKGTGRLAGAVGALFCVLPNRKTVYVGSGMRFWFFLFCFVLILTTTSPP